MSETVDKKLSELTGKIKALDFAIKKSDEVIDSTKTEILTRQISSITNRIQSIQSLKDEIEEIKFTNGDSEENVQNWAEKIESKINAADEKVSEIRQRVNKIRETEKATAEETESVAADIERQKQLEFEKQKFELQQAAKDEEHKRELKHKTELLNQQLEYEKSVKTSPKEQEPATSIKLPKLPMTKFDGNFAKWLPFWNTFEAEVDKADVPPVTKFAFLKEWLEPKVRDEVEGLPFTTEGYQRAKNILKSEYGKTSEIVNTHVQNIMGLPVIADTNAAKVNEFYKSLLYNTQALETLGKLDKVSGMTRSVLEKLRGIKADLVRGNEGWQDWDLTRLIAEIKKWRDINPVEDNSKKQRKSGFYHATGRKRACVYCDAETHNSKGCPTVTDVDQRKKMLAEKKLCFNCTGIKHRAADCKSVHKCAKCNMKHHSSICTKKDPLLTANGLNDGSLVYPVVVVNVEGIKCRALLDTGAGNSYASAALLDLLPKRSRKKEVRRVEMMLGSVTKEMELSTLRVEAVNGEFAMDVSVTKVDKGELLFVDNPNYAKLINSYQHLEGVQMEDKDQKPKLPVHLILGAGDYMRIKTAEKPRVGKIGEPVAERTKFGWTILAQGNELDYSAMLLTQTSQRDYEELCRLDVLGLEDKPEHDQHEVYAEFREQLTRSEEGWYETGLPWKGNHPPLPNNYSGSLQRLSNLQRKLQLNGLTDSYSEIIETQKAEGIVEVASQDSQGVEFYIPHKPVVRESAESTKMRIVYDASAKANGEAPSLNQCLNPGPPLQNDLWNILVKMRFHPVALSGDVKQAFLKVRIKETDRDALRFHWSPDANHEVETLRFTRALFGLTSSPFLLGGVLEHHLKCWESRKPEVVAELRKSLYVDDLVSGKTTVEQAQAMKDDAIEIFNDATFTLHKWHSNRRELEETTSDNEEEKTFAKQQLGTPSEGEASILGLAWSKDKDELKVVVPSGEATTTKRGILSKLAQIYDPLGLLSPRTLQGKIVYREVCNKKMAWDAQISAEQRNHWLKWEKQLPTHVAVPRSIPTFQEDIGSIVLHAFGDASGKGVAAVVYAVVNQPSGTTQGLVSAKARLAKQGLTIPRLELVSAHMASNLVDNVRKALDGFPVQETYCWLDSTVALHWIKGGGEHKQFVANRVQKIQSKPDIQWRYVPTECNPADVGSRGGKVKDNQLWLNGPDWLKDNRAWPKDIVTIPTKESEAEAKIIKTVLGLTQENSDCFDHILEKFLSRKSMRICAWVMRFVTNLRHPNRRTVGPLTTDELEQQYKFWGKRVQRSCDSGDDKLRLNLQENHQGILECRGRIQGHYPVYLPDKHIFTTKIVEDAHLRTLHGGVGLTMALVREQYWVPRLRQLTRKVIKSCYGCRRFQAKAVLQPTPGMLPPDRTDGSRPFGTIGVDFAGPIKYVKKRKEEGKAYILLYACSLTRAVYLELMPSLDTQKFIESFKQFIARKGRPSKVYSDNAKTFVSAANWLRAAQNDEKLNEFLSKNRIRWQFNLSRAPWWGGQFERLIGLVKRALHKTIGKGSLKWDELKEVLLDIEVTLNTRPLSYMEDDVQLPTLTPNSMLFIGSTFAPELEAHHIEEKDLRKRAKYLLKCKDAMRRRWSREYLSGLRERHNQNSNKSSFTVQKGDVVVIQSDERNRGKWPLGIVEELYKGRDGVVRAVKLRAGKTYLERAVNHLYPLELSCDRTESVPVQLDPKAPSFRPRRDAAVAARERIKEVARVES